MSEVGDLITHDGQYEFRRAWSDSSVLFNGRTPEHIKMMKLDGLFGLPELRSGNVEKQAGDGWIPGTSFLGARILTGDIALLANSQYTLLDMMSELIEAMQPSTTDGDSLFVYRKPRVGKRLIYCRPDKLSLPSEAEIARGLGRGVIQWTAHDPRIYALQQNVVTITVPAGSTSGVGTVHMAGNWDRGVPAVVEVNGPGNEIRVANADYENRQIKLTGLLASNETYLLDTGRLTVTDVGTGTSRIQRLTRDNQWWLLNRNDNTITVNRTDTAGTLIVKIYWRDAYTV